MKKKLGFTLAELILCIGIIGILSTLAISTIKPYDKAIKYLYSNTFHTLNRVYYNAMSDYLPQHLDLDPFGDEDAQNNLVHAVGNDFGTERLCKLLDHYINTTGAECKAEKAIGSSGAGSDFNDNNVQFTAVNGIKFYISRMYSLTYDASTTLKYYLVFADLNGERGPNTLEYSESRDPDIFTFAVVGGDVQPGVLPIGIAEIEPKYLLSRVVHVTTDATKDNVEYDTESYPYYISKARAWGYYGATNKGSSGTVCSTSQVNDTIDDTPFTYNAIIRSNIDSNNTNPKSLITAPLEDFSWSYTGEAADKSCSCLSADDCWVIIDRYAY